MRTYYIHENGQQAGPFSIEELKNKAITSQTPIWTEGMDQWLEAGKIEELKSIIIKTPPPFNFQASSQSTFTTEDIPSAFKEASGEERSARVKKLRWIGALFVIVLIISLVIYQNSESNSNNSSYGPPSTYTPPRIKTPEELKAELLESERLNAGKYIKGRFSNRENFIGQRVIELTFINNATLASFKDALLRITFLSKTGSELGYQHFTIYEYFGAGQTVKRKIKLNAPYGTFDVSVGIESAIPVN